MTRQYFAVCLLAFAAQSAFGQALNPQCGSMMNRYGPFDYTNPVHFKEKLPIVEYAHFDAGVEKLKGHLFHPNSLKEDLDYTLRAFPNHHRALWTMARYHQTMKSNNRAPMRYSDVCYFERAMVNAPADGAVRLIYGIHLYRQGKLEAAEKRFNEALNRSPDDPEVHYNLGLMLTKQERYEEALMHAKKAYELGHPMAGLRNKLKRAGHWE